MPLELTRIVRLTSFADEERTRPRLRYWLSQPPEERVAAVEFLRRQVDGSGVRLLRVHRVLDCGVAWDADIDALRSGEDE